MNSKLASLMAKRFGVDHNSDGNTTQADSVTNPALSPMLEAMLRSLGISPEVLSAMAAKLTEAVESMRQSNLLILEQTNRTQSMVELTQDMIRATQDTVALLSSRTNNMAVRLNTIEEKLAMLEHTVGVIIEHLPSADIPM